MTFDNTYTIPKMVKDAAKKYSDLPAQNIRHKDGNFSPVNYHTLFELGLDFGAALISLGVKRTDTIGLIADNRPEWLQADLGILAIGAIDVPRGCDATLQDLENILTIPECKVVIVENQFQLKKILTIRDKIPTVAKLITLCPDSEIPEELIELSTKSNCELYFFNKLIAEGKKFRADNPDFIENELEKGSIEDTATIIFTSGTTGKPKGVMLSHKNFLTQLDEIVERIYVNPGENVISVLPVWHVFERECEYVILIQDGNICYSKPIGPILMADFKKLNPVIIPAVPRIFEAIYDGITKKMRKAGGLTNDLFNFFVKIAILQKRMSRKMFRQNPCFSSYHTVFFWFLYIIPWSLLWPLYWLGNLLIFRKIKATLGNNFRGGVSGGGALPPQIDEFFWAMGIKVVEGYGMTETAPIISVRPFACPVFGTVGSPIRGVQARIVDPKDGFILGRCKEGVLQVKGPTVMKGYYKAPELTAKAISEDGWLDTGDIAIMTIHDELQIKGRIKDTIVLRGGENLEPVPIEMKLAESKFIKQAVVLGQDKNYLAALILVDQEEIKSYAEENGIIYDTPENLLNSEEIQKLYSSEINDLISSKNGFKLFERISKFKLITKDFEVGVELSAKQEIMRFRINELYKNEIESLFS